MTSAAVTAPEPVAATRLWCLICRDPKPFHNRIMPDAAKQRRPGFHGEHLVCVGCGTTIVTCYVDAAAAGVSEAATHV